MNAVILPAIPVALEAARQYRCSSNLHELGLAFNSYHEIHGSLPPAAFWTAEGEDVEWIDESPTSGRATYANWVQLLLPSLDESERQQQIDASVPAVHPKNKAARTAQFSLLNCPSDTFNTPENLYLYPLGDDKEANFARGNYAINGGTHRDSRSPCNTASPCPGGYHYEFDVESRSFQWYGSGVAGFNKSFSWDDFTNGRSTTVAIDEIRAGVSPLDPRGVWALGQIGGSVTWAHGINGDDYGPNNLWQRSDDILGCKELHRSVGSQQLLELGMPCCWYCRWNAQATSRSMHDGGVNALMADGGVRFISDYVDLGVWHVMHSRETPQEAWDDIDGQLAVRELVHPGSDWSESAVNYAVSELSSERAQPSGQKLTNSIGMSFVEVPNGEFIMGLPDEGNDHALPENVPAHRVRITQPFFLGQHEVTQAEYETVMGENPSWHVGEDSEAAIDGGQTSRFPVEQVSWDDAFEFCRKLTAQPEERKAGRRYRLPTEAEWEYACRSGKRTPYLFKWTVEAEDRSGATAGKNNKLRDRGVREPLPVSPVESFEPNEYGLYDMRGNVHEWCADWFQRDYYSQSPVDDPLGPETGSLKVVRGSDWIFVGEGCKINRRTTAPWRKSRFIGFRVVCEIQ